MKNRLPEIFAGLSILLAIWILINQKLTHHFWFKWADFWHHESIEGCFVALAIGLLLGKYFGRAGRE